LKVELSLSETDENFTCNAKLGQQIHHVGQPQGLHGLEDLMVKDLRTWMSHILKNRFGFTTKEVADE